MLAPSGELAVNQALCPTDRSFHDLNYPDHDLAIALGLVLRRLQEEVMLNVIPATRAIFDGALSSVACLKV